MCGIAGLWLHKQAATLGLAVRQMTATLAHRGPDGEGVWVDETAQLGLGHRRLAILDLSPQGAQPMQSAAGNVLVLNGEIYNYRELRRELTAQGDRFQSQTDTEVLLAGLERWGSRPVCKNAGECSRLLFGTPRNAACTWRGTGWEKNRFTTGGRQRALFLHRN